MGKIKGWKKLKGKQVWKSTLTHKIVSIERYSEDKVFVAVRNMYGSEVTATSGLKSKSLALKKAYQYMRMHPNG